MERKSDPKGKAKRSGSRANEQAAHLEEHPRASKVNRTTNTKRQRDLETRKEKACNRHRSQHSETLPTISIRTRARTRTQETNGDESERGNEVQQVLGESDASVITLSATLDPDLDKYAVRLDVILPGGGRTHFAKGRLDPGCPTNLINMGIVQRFRLKVTKGKRAIDLRGISRFSETAKKCAVLCFRINPWPRVFKVAFWILEEECMVNDVLFGSKFLEQRLQIRTNDIWRAITTAPLATPSA